MEDILPLLPELPEYSNQDQIFENHKNSVRACLEKFLRDASQSSENINSLCEDPFFISNVILFIGEYSNKSEPWYDDVIYQQGQKLLNLVLKANIVSDVKGLLYKRYGSDSGKQELIFTYAIEMLCRSLQKDNFRQKPASSSAFVWIMEIAEGDLLAPELTRCLALSLLLADDYMPENRKKGLFCLDQIVRKSTSTRLKWYNRCDVIFDCLSKMLHFNEECTVEALYMVILVLLHKCYNQSGSLKFTKSDIVFQRLVEVSSLEQNPKMREVYSMLIFLYVRHQNLRVLMWRKDLFRIWDEYLADKRSITTPTHRNVLQVLFEFCRLCSPRLKYFMGEVLEITLKFIYDTLAQNELLDKSVKSVVIDILVLLVTKEPTLFASLTEGLERTKFENLKFNDFILEALKKLQIEESSEAT